RYSVLMGCYLHRRDSFTGPSQTALTAAAARAAHLIVDAPPFIFADAVASALLGDRGDELIGYHRQHASHPILSAARAQVICRSRYTENHLARAAANGVRQYVILGAGLDSFGYRPGLAGYGSSRSTTRRRSSGNARPWRPRGSRSRPPSRSSPPTSSPVRWPNCRCWSARRSPRDPAHEPTCRGEGHPWADPRSRTNG